MDSIRRIAGLDFVRIMAAIGIVLFHFSCHSEYQFPALNGAYCCKGGDIWVPIFLMISGYCLAKKYATMGMEDLATFYRKRWLSIFPSFYIAYIIAFVILIGITKQFWWNPGAEKISLFLSFLGVDGYMLSKVNNYYILGEWFLGAILVMYLIFPFLLVLLKRLPWISLLVIVVLAWWLPYVINPDYSYMSVFIVAQSFYVGMLLCKIDTWLQNRWVGFVSAVIAIGLLVCPIHFLHPLHYLGVVVQDLFILVALWNIGAWIESFLPGKVSKYMGKLSYSVFLVHHFSLWLLFRWHNPTDLGAMLGWMGLSMVIIMVASVLLDYLTKLVMTGISRIWPQKVG